MRAIGIVLLLLSCAPSPALFPRPEPEPVYPKQPVARPNAFGRHGQYVIACKRINDFHTVCKEGIVRNYFMAGNKYYVWFDDGEDGFFDSVQRTKYTSIPVHIQTAGE